MKVLLTMLILGALYSLALSKEARFTTKGKFCKNKDLLKRPLKQGKTYLSRNKCIKVACYMSRKGSVGIVSMCGTVAPPGEGEELVVKKGVPYPNCCPTIKLKKDEKRY